KAEVVHDGGQRRAQAACALARVVAAVGRLLALEMLGRDRRAPEDELVAVVAPVQNLARDRVEEGLGQLRLPVLVQQGDIRELDRGPQRLVGLGLGKARENAVDALLYASVVHRDALARENAHFRPVSLLE